MSGNSNNNRFLKNVGGVVLERDKCRRSMDINNEP